MESNTKLMFEELMKMIQSMHSEMKEGFVAHDAAFAARDAELTHVDQQHKERVTGLESVAAEFDKSFDAWKPKVDSSLSSIKFELAKLNVYFDRDAKAPRVRTHRTSSTVGQHPTAC
jgi:arginyl-tRNA synthetase